VVTYDIRNIQPDVFRLSNFEENKLGPCVRDKNKNDLVKIIKKDNLIQKCDKGFTNRPKCDKCADGYTGYPKCKKEKCEDKNARCAGFKSFCGILQKEMLQNCKKTCGRCIGSHNSHATEGNLCSWSKWSSCSKACGNGLQKRTRTIVISAKNGGKQCDGRSKGTRLCNNGCKGIQTF
jgi:hypothetical protein